MILTPSQAFYFSVATLQPGVMDAVVPIRPDLLNQVVLRDYQLDLLRRAAAAMRQGYRRVLIVLPTGGGKTVLAGEALKCALGLGFTGQFLVHRKELIDQTSQSFGRMRLPHGFIAAGRPMDLSHSIALAGIQTLANRLDVVLPPNLIIADEAHHAVAETWARVFDSCQDSYVLGLTATPQRLDGKGLDGQFDIMIVGPSVAELAPSASNCENVRLSRHRAPSNSTCNCTWPTRRMRSLQCFFWTTRTACWHSKNCFGVLCRKPRSTPAKWCCAPCTTKAPPWCWPTTTPAARSNPAGPTRR